jgi:hypothetical protein
VTKPPCRSLLPLSLLGTAAVGLAAFVPGSASASGAHTHGPIAVSAGTSEERRAAREQERAARSEERVNRAEERRAARAQKRAAQRGGRLGSASAGPSEPGLPPGEAGTGTPREAGTSPDGSDGRGCKLSIEASSHQITAGEPVTVSGRLNCPTRTNATGRVITILQGQQPRHALGAAALSNVGTATTEADGSFSFTPPGLATNTVFRVREGHHGAHTAVKVAPAVTLNTPTPAAQLSSVSGRVHAGGPSRTTFSGTVSPIQAGALVALQVAYASNGEQWHPVAFGHVGADGTYAITHGFRTSGEANVRVVVHPKGPNVVAASAALAYDVPDTQNPQLTINASADPLAYGQSVAISGVAVGATNQPVTLLARGQGKALAVVAQTTTDASGDYTFSQAPEQNTYYTVKSAATKSVMLFEGVEIALTSDPTPSTVQAGQQVVFSGALAPAATGQQIYLERTTPSGLGFHVVAVGTVSSDSTYSITYTFSSASSSVMRILAPANAHNQASAGKPFTVAVTPATVDA